MIPTSRPSKGNPVVGDFRKLLAAVWEVPHTPQILYLGSRTPKHSVICVSDSERVDFHQNPGSGSGEVRIRRWLPKHGIPIKIDQISLIFAKFHEILEVHHLSLEQVCTCTSVLSVFSAV